MASFSYGANLALPASSDVDPKYEGVPRELTMLMQAARTLAVYVDAVTGRAIYSDAEIPQLIPEQQITGGPGFALYVKAAEPLVFGAMVNLVNSGGQLAGGRHAHKTAVQELHAAR